MGSLLDEAIERRYREQVSPEQAADLFEGREPTRNEKALAAAGKLAKQRGIEPGGFGAPIAPGGIDLFGQRAGFEASKSLEREQQAFIRALDKADTDLLTNDIQRELAESQRLREARHLVGSNASELSDPSFQAMLARGDLPTKDVESIAEVLGPTQALFNFNPPIHKEGVDDRGRTINLGAQSQSQLQALGGGVTHALGQALPFVSKSPFLQKVSHPAHEDSATPLVDALHDAPIAGTTVPGGEIERLARQADPGLAAVTTTETVIDEAAPLSDRAILREALAQRTRLTTPGQQQISQRDVASLLSQVTGQQVDPSQLPQHTPSALVNTLLTQIGQERGRTTTQRGLNARLEKQQSFREKQRREAEAFRVNLFDHQQAVTTENKLLIQQVSTEQQLLVQGSDATNRATLQRQRAENSLNNQLAVLEEKFRLDGVARGFDVEAQYLRDVTRGAQELDQQYFGHLLRLSEAQSQDESVGRGNSAGDLFKDLVKSTIKANPQLAPSILASMEEAELSPNQQLGVRGAVYDTIRNFQREQAASNRVATILRGGDQSLGESFTNNSQKINAMAAELHDPRSQADKATIREEMARLEELQVQKTSDVTPSQQKDIVETESLIAQADFLEQTYDPSLVGPLGNKLAQARITMSNALSFLGADGLSEMFGLTPSQALFVAQANQLKRLVVKATGGSAFTAIEQQLIEASTPVPENPNFVAAMKIFKLNLRDIQSLREAERAGDDQAKARFKRQVLRRAQAMIADAEGGGSGTEATPFASEAAARHAFEQFRKDGKTAQEAMALINQRGVQQ